MRVVAEGIERQDQADALVGCLVSTAKVTFTRVHFQRCITACSQRSRTQAPLVSNSERLQATRHLGFCARHYDVMGHLSL